MNIIDQYINKITINNINDFAIKNNIILNKNELFFLEKLIKSDYRKIIEDISPYKQILNENISKENVNKIIDLYHYYKNIYY